MKLINEQEIYDTWSPLIESKAGITDEGKKGWLTKYCHYHSLNESAGAYNSLGVVNGMGAVAPPAFPGMPMNGTTLSTQANAGFYNQNWQGSGDKFPSLLPLAIQVAAKTIGFDIVPVIPMSGPTGILSYLDYVYSGGKLNGATGSDSSAADALAKAPTMVKFPVYQGSATGITGATAGSFQVGYTYGLGAGTFGGLTLQFIGLSRIDGFPIFQVDAISANFNIAQCINGTSYQLYSISTDTGASSVASTVYYTGTSASNNGWVAQLVKALEDHIQGFSGAGFNNDQNWQGPYVDGTKTYNPMLRGVGESTYFNQMGLSTFTKFVEAETFQVAAAVTTEQIQDLNKQFGIDVISMIENALVNEVSQAINKHILARAFALGWSNHIQFNNVENQNLNLNLVLGGSTGTTSAYVNKTDTGIAMAIPAGPATSSYENLSTLQRRLFSRILAAANVVANRGRRGPANFIVTNAAVASALQDISQFTFAPFSNTLTQNNGTLYPVGSLAGMTVYVDQNMSYNDTRVLIGRKGGDDEPGLKFMPYMMAESIQTISEGTMSPKIAVKSRYALVEAGMLPETMYLTFYVNVPQGGLA
jgi:hypothetical protein